MTLPPSLKRGSSDNEEFIRQQRRRVDFDNILEIDADDIELDGTEPVNVAGHFSDLFVGYYRRRAKVALKRPRTARNGNIRDVVQKFEEEAQVWKILRHPHILEFVGIYKSDGHMYLVSPFMENGTLKEYIESHPDTNRPKFICETADALAYLHAMKIIHGDVKASNILISSDLRALICDFGLAKWMPTITASQSKGAGTVRWQSPELWNGASRCFASDVYAFGITVAEVLSGEIPFSDFQFDGAVINAVSIAGARPKPKPSHSTTGESYQHIWNVASRCWRTEPESRPMMKEVLDCLLAPALITAQGEMSNVGSSLDEPVYTESLLPNSVVEVASPEPFHVFIEDTEWITFTPAIGRTPGKFQPSKATNQAYGAFSDVKKCELIYEDGGSETAALKRLRPVRLGSQAEDVVDIDRERFEREILVWAGIWHSNVAPLLGFTLSPDFYLISPWYPNGTIRQYIATHPGCDRLNLIQDVASGLAYLHTCQPPIVHGDIKSNNVVVDADGHAKIIDFGLSQILEHSTSEANTVMEVGNSRWMAPEVMTSQQITCASDVYSFGCLALETASNLPPFRSLQQGLRQIVTRPTSLKPVTDRSAYARIPEDNPLWDLLFSCWENDPGKRPSMTELGTQLRGLISSRVPLGRSPRSSPSSSGSGSSRSQAPTQIDSPSNLLLSIRPTGNPSSEWSAFFQKSGLPAGRYRRLNSQMLGCGVLSDSWLCEMERDGEVQQVAAKELRFTRESTDMFRRALEGLERDARTWMAFKHPNIVPVLGYTFERTFLLLRHWCPNGNIRDYLKRKPECDKLRLMHDATCGLSYIHAQDIVHGNIRPENVLIDAEGQARIVDCGISKVAEEMPTFHTSMVKIDCRWIAPELALGDQRYQMSSSSDVYSLGCLAILVLADREPYEDYRTNRGVTDAMNRDEEPASQDTLWLADDMAELWTACWRRNPELRPTAEDLKARISNMLR